MWHYLSLSWSEIVVGIRLQGHRLSKSVLLLRHGAGAGFRGYQYRSRSQIFKALLTMTVLGGDRAGAKLEKSVVSATLHTVHQNSIQRNKRQIFSTIKTDCLKYRHAYFGGNLFWPSLIYTKGKKDIFLSANRCLPRYAKQGQGGII